jgi:hypothetical protein
LCSSKYVLGRYGEGENGLVVLHAMGEGRNASRPRGWCLWVAVALHCAVIARRVCEWHVSARLQSSVIRISSRLSSHGRVRASFVLQCWWPNMVLALELVRDPGLAQVWGWFFHPIPPCQELPSSDSPNLEVKRT